MTLPLNFRPLLAEAARLAQEAHDAGADDESIVPRWDGLSPPMRTRLVNAQARLLANPNRRDSQAWMAEWIVKRLPMQGWTWGRVIDAAHHDDERTMLLRCCRVAGVPEAASAALVACVLALYEREGR